MKKEELTKNELLKLKSLLGKYKNQLALEDRIEDLDIVNELNAIIYLELSNKSERSKKWKNLTH